MQAKPATRTGFTLYPSLPRRPSAPSKRSSDRCACLPAAASISPCHDSPRRGPRPPRPPGACPHSRRRCVRRGLAERLSARFAGHAFWLIRPAGVHRSPVSAEWLDDGPACGSNEMDDAHGNSGRQDRHSGRTVGSVGSLIALRSAWRRKEGTSPAGGDPSAGSAREGGGHYRPAVEMTLPTAAPSPAWTPPGADAPLPGARWAGHFEPCARNRSKAPSTRWRVTTQLRDHRRAGS